MFVAICDGRHDCSSDETDDDENGACYSGVGFIEVVWAQDLVQQGRNAVEEAYVDGEWDENLPEFPRRDQLVGCYAQGRVRDCRGCTWWCWW